MISNEAKNSLITMKHSTFSTPNSWKSEWVKTGIKVESPENDLSVYLLELPMAGDFKKMAIEAWQQFQPHFNFLPTQESSPPPSDDWDKLYQIVYDVPASESRMVVTIIRSFKDHAYVCLLDSKIAGLCRRGAQFNMILESWKPIGFKETKLNSTAKKWTHPDTEDFEKFISDSMQQLKIPGMSIAVIHADGEVYSKGFGVKQVGSHDPVTTDTPFMIGSTTKPLTTLLMGILVDQKKLSWDILIIDILPNFSLADADLTRKLTIRQTVSASTGMPRGGLECIFKYTGISPEDRIAEMKTMAPTTKMGEVFQYSNYLVMTGGFAAAKASFPESNLENAYSAAMKKYVFEPLEMHKTVLKPEHALQLGAALPHGTDFNGNTYNIPFNIESFAYSIAPAGAIWSTVNDMANYLLLEMSNGTFKGKRVISDTSILERRKPIINISEKSSYGLCLINMNEQGLNLIGHDGATLGFSSMLFFIPESKIGMVILCNIRLAHQFLHAIKQKFIELTFNAKLRSKEMVNSFVQERENTIKRNQASISLNSVPTPWLEKMLGTYPSITLGPAILARAADGEGYEIRFTEWKTKIGSEIEPNGKKLLVMIDAPSYCGVKLLVENNGDKLVLDGGQEQHEFIRQYALEG